ncbi:MarR family winged helix-turn-helix transcriptional regulator [Mycobacterium asiaticum]|uniref:MarR family transcriptional regulator n=1 Tax=Mycobacterium asiaticum TaxID=1790 RepID=A0A1A3NUC2_MYCAS|nr:MarR family winged helix-turn-helix transcriptional regulator [Mycobacterium asiaticum]OBK23922.1 MarR family transcriptional regulator [Mycobacterium asiaticum]
MRTDSGSSSSDSHRLSRLQQEAWLSYMRVYHRLEYEMNRQLQLDCGLSLSDYTVLNALSNAPGHRAQLSSLATVIGWERSRLSHHLQRMSRRGLVDRVASDSDGRGTDVVLTAQGKDELVSAAPKHAAHVKRLFFAGIDSDQERQLAEILTTVYETILREGALPKPDFGPEASE